MIKNNTASAIQSDITTEAKNILKDFEYSLPNEPIALDSLSKSDLEKKLQHSYEQSMNGQGTPAAKFFDELERI